MMLRLSGTPLTCSRHPDSSAIVFDLDGVLLDSTSAHASAFTQTFTRLNLPLVPYDSLAGRKTEEVFSEIIAECNPGLTPGELASATQDATKLKRELAADALSEAPLIDGVADFIEQLKRNNVRIAIATSAGGVAIERTRELLRFEDFEFMLNAQSVRRLKPAPDIYQAAAARFQLPPDRVLVMEDSTSGLTAAKLAGTCTVAIVGAHPAPAVTEIACNNIRDFLEVDYD